MNNNRTLSSVVVSSLLLVGANAGLVNPVEAAGLIAEDLDNNTYVDGADFTLFQQCLGGSGIPHDGTTTCQAADIDYDGDVDMADFGVMQRCYSGTGVPGDPACACVRPKANLAIGAAPNPTYSGQATYVAVALSQAGVNYQLRNNADNANIGSPVAGTGGTIYLSSDLLASTRTFNVLAINAAAGCSVQLNGTVAVTVIPYTPHNKIGAHVVMGSRNGYGPFLADTAAAGKPVAVIKCLDDYSPGGEAKGYSSQTVTIGRKNDLPPGCVWNPDNCDLQGFDHPAEQGVPPETLAQQVFDALLPTWGAHRNDIDVWEVCNEWSSWWAYQADFYIAMMNIAEPRGYRIGLFSCSVGNPPESSWPDIARACARAKAHGGHILCLHEYGFPYADLLQDSYNLHPGDQPGTGGCVLRYRRLYNYLIPRNADCPLALTEVGHGNGCCFVGKDRFVQDFGWYDTQLRQDPYVLGCAAYTLGHWENANFQDALPNLTNYIIAH